MLERNVLIDGAVYHEHRVTRLNTSVGQSTIDANVYEPGVYGWEEVQ